MLSPEDKEMAMDVHEEFEQWEREVTERGRAEGRAEGQLKLLIHRCERLLRRALTAAERDTLAVRLREQGAEHVDDVVLDLSAEDLAAWLTATNGH